MARRDSVGTTASVAATVAAVPSRLVLFLAFMVPRVLVSLGPHSGESSPPMYGDFEAQRHWMEVTTSVPLRDWYRDAPGNNLTYWGLDYPPLSAYFARALGDLSRGIIPALVAPTSSWGYEELAGKIFMRASVIAADALVLLPAVALVTAEHKATLAVLVLSQPGLLIIDHGHFQYNGVGLGLALAAAAVVVEAPLLSAVLYTLAFNFKQTNLYYAPIFFVVLLTVAFRGGLQGVVAGCRVFCEQRGRRRPSLLCIAAGVGALGVVVLTTVVLLWAPFCFASVEHPDGCTGGLLAVVRRLAPLDRGLFEDKPANIWCALEPVLRLRQHLFQLGHTTTRLHFYVALLCALVVLTLLAPAAVILLSTNFSSLPHPRRPRHVLLALAIGALSFFLGAFQVHEKAILIAALPLSALASDLPVANALFSVASLFSMWPLLVKDGLLPQAVLLGVAYVCACFYLPDQSALATARASEVADIATGFRALSGMRVSNYAVSRALRSVAGCAGAAAAGIALAACFAAPPSRLPDLFPYMTAVLCAALFSIFLCVFTLVLLAWALQSSPGAEAAGSRVREKSVVRAISASRVKRKAN